MLDKLPAANRALGRHVDGWCPLWLGLCLMLFGSAVSGANFLTAGALLRRERRTLCMLTAVVNCLFVPLGTLIGAFTIAVLSGRRSKPRSVPSSDRRTCPHGVRNSPLY